ncbi:MAG: sensor domain-containing diguanylate cyclase [Butyrivibrio sp.]|nr:sensor domain-containing diguanylate cyclase [Butyrivibrio sp.]
MKQVGKNRFIRIKIKIVGTVVPIVLLMIFIFLSLTRNKIVELSKEKLALESKNYAVDVSTWAEQILNELDIYKSLVEEMGTDDYRTFEMLKTSCGAHEAYPYGLYWGDEKGNYFDSSDWEPEEDYVVAERTWYIEGLEHDEFVFGEPYGDAFTGGTCISVTSRVDSDSLVSVLSADVYFDYAQRLVEEITSGSIENAFFVTGGSRIIVADADSQMVGKSLTEEDNPLLYRSVNLLLEEDRTGQSVIKGENGSYFADINKIGNMNWYFVTLMSRKDVLRDLHRLEAIMLIVAAAAVAALTFLTIKFAKEMGESRLRAKTDSLTGLLNRDGFRERMFSALKLYPNQGVLLFMDMDNFKLINDQLGHPVGDRVLVDFAALLEEYFNRNKDIVARIGGDEFAVFVGRPIKAAETNAMLKKFTAIFHSSFDGEYSGQGLSVSIGGVFVSEEASYEELYRSADNALYEVKKKGKDGFYITDNE